MKKITISLVLALAAISTAQAEENKCLTMLEKMKENVVAAGDQEAADEINIEEFKQEWAEKSEEERQQANEECAALLQMMAEAEKMQ